MLRPAIWVLEQEYKFAKKHFSWSERGPPTVERDPFFIFGGLVAAGFQTAAITSLGYSSVLKAGGLVDEYVWVRTAPQHAIKGFRIGPGIQGFQPYGWSTSRRAMFRLGAAKVASRFIPYVGWALLAYDVYMVGKWARSKF